MPNFEKYNHDIGIGCKAGIEGKNIPDIGTLANVLGTDLRPKMYAIFYVTRVNPGCDDPKNKTSIECMLNDQQQFTAKAH